MAKKDKNIQKDLIKAFKSLAGIVPDLFNESPRKRIPTTPVKAYKAKLYKEEASRSRSRSRSRSISYRWKHKQEETYKQAGIIPGDRDGGNVEDSFREDCKV